MRIGLDVGSTTIKAVVLDDEGSVLYQKYVRHYSLIVPNAVEVLTEIRALFPDNTYALFAISGSAGMGLSSNGGIPFVQEVYATRVASSALAPAADVLIELGGEDAKILFLEGIGEARMNGTCAGGTGAFIDQMSTLLKLTPSELNEKAKKHERIYSIASRCGVFAKSDVQPLLNQGACIEDVAASILYAIVNQTIAGLAQGRKIHGNILYLGGPLTFMSELRRAFDDVLGINGNLPENSLYFVAHGAAMYASASIKLGDAVTRLKEYSNYAVFDHSAPLFSSEDEYSEFTKRHSKAEIKRAELTGFSGRAHLGVDAGSTTVKTALISDDGELLYSSYLPNSGNPVPLVREALLEVYEACPELTLSSVTTTGYGEELIKAAINADFGVVETVAHFMAARYFNPNVDFIIDIGGQDMKCFKVENGAISDIFLNEACSSGCGSFLQTFAEALGEDIRDFAKRGLYGDAPVELGSRCTVFMNSSVKQAQKDGASVENISAGLAMSVVKNALYKVIRPTSPEDLGKNIVVQGGTFHNDAVLRAFEKEMGVEVIRPVIAGLMGAFGAALYGKSRVKSSSSCLKRDEIISIEHTVKSSNCSLCANNCSLTVNKFSGGRKYISGNRCDRGLSAQSGGDELNLYEYKRWLLSTYKPIPGIHGKIGMPMGLNFFEMLPFYHTLFTHLGFEVITSPPSTRKLYFMGQATIPSDTVCYPAKLMHGHIKALSEIDGVDTIFYPCMSYNFDEGISANHFNCPVVAYYPEVISANCPEILEKTFIYDYLGVHRKDEFAQRLHKALRKHYHSITYDDVILASKLAYNEYDAHMKRIRDKAKEIITKARSKSMRIIVLAGRPYHIDPDINHGIDKLIMGYGAAVISEDGIPAKGIHVDVLNQWTYHARLYSAAKYIAKVDDMELVQLVSFGCGLDAVTTDEVRAILHKHDKLYTQIKIDEIANLGAVNIRLKSLFAALGDTKREAL